VRTGKEKLYADIQNQIHKLIMDEQLDLIKCRGPYIWTVRSRKGTYAEGMMLAFALENLRKLESPQLGT